MCQAILLGAGDRVEQTWAAFRKLTIWQIRKVMIR